MKPQGTINKERTLRKAAVFGLFALGIVIAPLAEAQSSLAAAFAKAAKADAAGQHRAARAQFQALADRGFAPAEAKLGTLYLAGRGVTADAGIAAVWFYKAARSGYPPAQFAYARLRLTGEGVAANPAEAFFWSSLAAERGRPEIRSLADRLKQQAARALSATRRLELRQKVDAWRPDRAILR